VHAVDAADAVDGVRRLVGRPRDPALDDRILTTTRELLVERGYDGLSVQEVTRRSGAHAATIRRRWPTKAGLVAASILRDDHPFWADDPALSVPTGQLRQDLWRMITKIDRWLSDAAVRAALPVLWGEVHHDTEVRERLEHRRAQWSGLVEAVLEASVRSGDAPAHVLDKTELLTDVLAGTAFARQGLAQRGLGESATDALTDLALWGLLGDQNEERPSTHP